MLVADVPEALVTLTSTVPAAPAGAVAVMEVAELTVKLVAATAEPHGGDPGEVGARDGDRGPPGGGPECRDSRSVTVGMARPGGLLAVHGAAVDGAPADRLEGEGGVRRMQGELEHAEVGEIVLHDVAVGMSVGAVAPTSGAGDDSVTPVALGTPLAFNGFQRS